MHGEVVTGFVSLLFIHLASMSVDPHISHQQHTRSLANWGKVCQENISLVIGLQKAVIGRIDVQ